MVNKVIQIDGGIGRVLCSVPAVEKFAKNQATLLGNKTCIITSQPEIFSHNPHIYKLYSLNNEHLWDDVIRQGDFILPEPYLNRDYYTQKHHLIQSFDVLLNGEEDKTLPTIYPTREEREWAAKFIANIRETTNSKYIVFFQFQGSSFNLNYPDDRDVTERSLSLALSERIIEETTQDRDFCYVNCSHVPYDHSKVWQYQFTLRQLLVATELCDFVVTIDSALSHIGAMWKKSGILILGGTYPKNIGYDSYQTIIRDGYPTAYFPNRFHSSMSFNVGALDFTEDEITELINSIKSKIE